MKPLPTIVASRTGEHVLTLVDFDGADGVPDRDAVAFYFRALNSSAEVVRFGVMFSGTVLAVRPDAFGLPAVADREEGFKTFSLAALGDYLDAVGPLTPTPPRASAHWIECFSPHFQEWADRDPVDDQALEQYLQVHLYEAWRREQQTWSFATEDALRLGRSAESARRIIDLGADELWKVVATAADRVELKPSKSLLRAQRRGDVAPKLSTASAAVEEEPSVSHADEPATFVYVDEARLADLRRLDRRDFDLRKVIALCEELNLCYRSQCYHAVAALTRALLDHIPPILGFPTLAQVASNYAAGKSLKACLDRLQGPARNIADMHLHQTIRKTESLPTRTQVNFSNELDLLLAELIRVLEDGDSAS